MLPLEQVPLQQERELTELNRRSERLLQDREQFALLAAGLSLLAGAERARASVGVALLGLWLLDIGENARASACPGRRRRRTDRNRRV